MTSVAETIEKRRTNSVIVCCFLSLFSADFHVFQSKNDLLLTVGLFFINKHHKSLEAISNPVSYHLLRNRRCFTGNKLSPFRDDQGKESKGKKQKLFLLSCR